MEQMSLFDDRQTFTPLASRLRPERLEEFAGQTHLLGKGKILRQLIDQDQIPSMIFWGPPGEMGAEKEAKEKIERLRAWKKM